MRRPAKSLGEKYAERMFAKRPLSLEDQAKVAALLTKTTKNDNVEDGGGMANTPKKNRDIVKKLNAAARSHPAVTPEIRALIRSAVKEINATRKQVDAWEKFRESVGNDLRNRRSYAGDPNPGGTRVLDDLYNDMPPKRKEQQ